MSSWNLGYDELGDDDILFYPPLPPYLEPPSTSFLGYNQQDLSLLFVDTYTQNNPNPSLEDCCIITHEDIDELGEGQENGNKSAQGDVRRVTSSSSLSKIMKQKKMDHNAKERVRRTHLNTAYIALRSSLPESHKPKKKWSASYLIDRAVDHIPQLEGDLVKLKSKKKDLLLEVEKVHDLKRAEEAEKREKTLSVCINEVKRGQLILQICRQRNKFSELLDMIENEGMEILNTFMLDTCEDRSSHHIHVKMDVSSVGGGDYVAELKEKLVTWLS